MCRRRCVDLGLLPLSVGLAMFLGIFTCYTIAVLKGHFDPILPSISDTGIEKPEEYIFSQFINVACALAVVTLLLRYKVVLSMLGADDVRLRRLALACCIIGVAGGMGLTLVANFPDDQAPGAHFTGAGMVFGFGTLYQFLDSILTYKMYPAHNGRSIVIVRSLLAVISILALATTLTGSAVFRLSGGSAYSKEDVLHWKPGQHGHAAFLVSNFAEWAMAFSFNCYFFTYISEFQNFTSHLDVRKLFCGAERSPENPVFTQGQVHTPQLQTPDQPYDNGGDTERTSLLSTNPRPTYV